MACVLPISVAVFCACILVRTIAADINQCFRHSCFMRIAAPFYLGAPSKVLLLARCGQEIPDEYWTNISGTMQVTVVAVFINQSCGK